MYNKNSIVCDVYITQRNERLDNIAYKYYNDVNMWKQLAFFNDLTENVLEENIKLYIPKNVNDLIYYYNNVFEQ